MLSLKGGEGVWELGLTPG